MYKKVALIIIPLCVCIIAGIIATNYNSEADLNAFEYISMALSGVVLFFGTSLLFWDKKLEIRKAICKKLVIVSVVFALLFLLLRYLHIPGTTIMFIVTFSFLVFTVLPLHTINRIEKWKQFTRKNWHAVVLSLGDLISLGAILLGYMFKKMHWPGANIMLMGGTVFLACCLISWNRLFSKEIILRKQAEEASQKAFEEIKHQNDIIKEKNEEILSSIRYAQRIQKSLMPNANYLKKKLN